MRKLPRNISGEELVRRLGRLDYYEERRHGSHAVLLTERHGGHRCFIAMHRAIKPGTLESILKNIAKHHRLALDELLSLLDF